MVEIAQTALALLVLVMIISGTLSQQLEAASVLASLPNLLSAFERISRCMKEQKQGSTFRWYILIIVCLSFLLFIKLAWHPAMSPPPEEKWIKATRKKFGEGTIAFKAPEEMVVSKTETYEVRIALRDQTAIIEEGLRGSGKTVVEPLKVSCRMKVSLTAGDAFTIVPITPSDVRMLDPQESYGSWKWGVTPKRSGTHDLHLVAEAIADIPKVGEKSLYIKTFDHSVKVGVDTNSVVEWILQHWEYVAGTITLPFIGWLWALYSKRKEKEESEKKPPDPPKIILP
jgi:hypothetical protein